MALETASCAMRYKCVPVAVSMGSDFGATIHLANNAKELLGVSGQLSQCRCQTF